MPAAWVGAAAAAYGALSKNDAPSGGGGGGANNQVARSETSGGSSSQSYIDPRMEAMLYGQGGIIPQAQNWYNNNSSGTNEQMITGMNNSWNQLGASAQGYNQMQNLGMQLMGGGSAGNPFTGQGGIAAQQMNYIPAQMSSGTVNPFSQQANQPTANFTGAAAAGGGGGGGEYIPEPVQQQIAQNNLSTLDWLSLANNQGLYAGEAGA